MKSCCCSSVCLMSKQVRNKEVFSIQPDLVLGLFSKKISIERLGGRWPPAGLESNLMYGTCVGQRAKQETQPFLQLRAALDDSSAFQHRKNPNTGLTNSASFCPECG